jgi:glycerol-3-phosphate dehydrogenase
MTGTPTTQIDAVYRYTALQRLAESDEPVDVVVIGGGITGAGAALDAATRGLSVVLVEAHDLAFGTSRWSSKLVHGGLRYLATGDVGIARESAVERHRIMTTIAPHLVSPMTQLVPIHSDTKALTRGLVRAGFVAGDALRLSAGTKGSTLPRSRRVGAATVLEHCPTVRPDGLRGGLVAHDGQLIDDARLVVGVARTAADHGATILTYTKAVAVEPNQVQLEDVRTGQTFTLAARSVINAAGVWADQVDPTIKLRPSRGTHLVFDAKAFGNPTAALTVQIPGHTNRFVFAMPEQLGRVYLGLTDEDAPGPVPDEPVPADSEVDFLIDTINLALAQPVSRADVIGKYAGLRPLLQSEGSTADLSRNHAVLQGHSGMISVVGGKLTTYRKMAEDAVDKAVQTAGLTAGPCRTATVPLIGAEPAPAAAGTPRSLIARFGGESARVVEKSSVRDPLAQIVDGIDVTRAEIEYAFTHEGAITVDDVLHRRTRIGLAPADADRARPAVEKIADAVGITR